MRLHTLREYKDGYKMVPYCCVCGVEYPSGDCSGKLVVDKKELTKDKEQTKSEIIGK